MKINIYDESLNRILIVGESFISCFWSEGYNTTQPFSLELNATEEYKKKIRPDCYIGRDDRKTLMVIKTVQANKDTIVCTGFTADRVLDDVVFVGTIKSGKYVDNAVAEAYNNSDKYPNIEYADTNLGIKTESQNSNKSFLQLSQKLCQETDLGFVVKRSNGVALAEFYDPGENENAIFAEKYGNLSVERVSLSTELEKNYAIVLGQGEGANRTKQIVDLSCDAVKKQIVIDARDVQQETDETDEEYSERLYARGFEKLLDTQKTVSCSISVSSADFGKKFDLGQIVTVLLTDYGIKLKARIAKFDQKEQNNELETKISIGNITILR
jgi:hypothetical protein